MYIDRRICKEIQVMLENVPGLESVVENATVIEGIFEGFQLRQRVVVEEVVARYLPGGWRKTLFYKAKERSERKREKAIERLIESGGSVKEVFELMWQQQWERRKMLEQVGNASGVWRLVISYLGGVPPVLLDYARDMNRRHGPTSQMRKLYGAKLFEITGLAIELRGLTVALAQRESLHGTEEAVQVLIMSTEEYRELVERYLTLLQTSLLQTPLYIEFSKLPEATTTKGIGKVPSAEIADEL